MAAGPQTPTIAGIWVGNTYGTHPATIYADFRQDGNKLFAEIRANMSGSVLQFAGEGTIDDRINLTLTEKVANGQEPAKVTITSKNLTDYSIEATWESTAGGAGVLNLSRYLFSIPSGAPGTPRRPAQIETREVQLNPVRMSRADIEALLLEIVKLLPQHTGIMVTVARGDKKTTNYAQDFVARRDLPIWPVEVFIGGAQGEGGAQKLVTITLGKDTNILRVAWNDLQWVIGATEVLADFLRQRANPVLTFWRKYLADINFLLFFVLLLLMPDLTLHRRVVFTVAMIALMFAHRFAIRWLTRTVIYLGVEGNRTSRPAWTIALAVATSAIGGTLAIMLYDVIKDWGWPFGIGQ